MLVNFTVISLFLRCLDTAIEVVHIVCAIGDIGRSVHMSSVDGGVIDASKIKVVFVGLLWCGFVFDKTLTRCLFDHFTIGFGIYPK